MSTYAEKLRTEAGHWGKQLLRQQEQHPVAWLDNPLIKSIYNAKRRIDGVDWPEWLKMYFGGQAGHAVDLGCGSGSTGLTLLQMGVVSSLTGYDVSDERLDVARARRVGVAADYVNHDANTIELQPDSCDLVFSSHSFHHFTELEYVMAQVAQALTPRGIFLLEEYVGPSIFQWTDLQLDLTNDLLAILPMLYRRYPGLPGQPKYKPCQPRPTVEQVQAVSPFEAIRSAEIVPLFRERFQVLREQPLGGTIQHLLYDSIVHNFSAKDAQAVETIKAIDRLETRLIASGVLSSDFMLLVGRKLVTRRVTNLAGR